MLVQRFADCLNDEFGQVNGPARKQCSITLLAFQFNRAAFSSDTKPDFLCFSFLLESFKAKLAFPFQGGA